MVASNKQGEGKKKMKKPNVIHVLSNGKRVKDITGHVVPADSAAYRVIFEVSKGGKHEKAC